MNHAYLCVLAALAASTATAQSGSRLNPADPEARVPAATYRSTFDGYRRVEGEARKDWREANDEVRRVGGHLGILREQAAREKPAQAKRK
jgi:hypothetical protein